MLRERLTAAFHGLKYPEEKQADAELAISMLIAMVEERRAAPDSERTFRAFRQCSPAAAQAELDDIARQAIAIADAISEGRSTRPKARALLARTLDSLHETTIEALGRVPSFRIKIRKRGVERDAILNVGLVRALPASLKKKPYRLLERDLRVLAQGALIAKDALVAEPCKTTDTPSDRLNEQHREFWTARRVDPRNVEKLAAASKRIEEEMRAGDFRRVSSFEKIIFENEDNGGGLLSLAGQTKPEPIAKPRAPVDAGRPTDHFAHVVVQVLAKDFQMLTGKPGALINDREGTYGAFSDFVGDVFGAIGIEAVPRAAIRAWQKRTKNTDP